MNDEILKIVEVMHKERNIDRDILFTNIEQALALATKKHLETPNMPVIKIDRNTGNITAYDGDRQIEPTELGRIVAQSAKQIIIQKLREVEVELAFNAIGTKKNDIVTGTVLRFEGLHLICVIGRAEAIMLKNEQVPGESYKQGDKIRAYVLDIEKKGARLKIYISRAHENFIKRLFELEIPEIADNAVELKNIVREPGYRTKILVHSNNSKIDCVGACIGVRGVRIKNIVDELKGENIDVVRWSAEPMELVRNAMKPAEVTQVTIDSEKKLATVYVTKEQLSQAIGKGGRNVKLASKLTRWGIDVREIGGEKEKGTDENIESKAGTNEG